MKKITALLTITLAFLTFLSITFARETRRFPNLQAFKCATDPIFFQTTGKDDSQSSNPETAEVVVETAAELIKELGSNKKILLKPGIYDLSALRQDRRINDIATWETVMDGKQLTINGAINLTLEGSANGKTEIKTSPRYAEIISFSNCHNITIKNITAGHTPAEYDCDAGVFVFNACQDILISNSHLYGCGSVGLSVNDSQRLTCADTLIDHCSLRAVDINNSETIRFTRTKLVNHEAYSNIVLIQRSTSIVFDQCELKENHHFAWSFFEIYGKTDLLITKCQIAGNTQPASTQADWGTAYFFKTADYKGKSQGRIIIRETEFTNNICDYFTDNPKAVTLENCVLNNNQWKN